MSNKNSNTNQGQAPAAAAGGPPEVPAATPATQPSEVEAPVAKAEVLVSFDTLVSAIKAIISEQLSEAAIETREPVETDSIVPEWAIELQKTIDVVIESNNQVIELIKAVGVDALETRLRLQTLSTGGHVEASIEKQAEIEIDPDARYVVAKGKKFVDKDTDALHEAGANVTKLHPDRLKSLIAQGIVVEA